MRRWIAGCMAVGVLSGAGCALTIAKRSPWDIQQLEELSEELEQFKTLAQLKADEADELRRAKALLEQRLSSADVSVGYDERGLVTRVVDRVLFDSGKADLRRGAYPVLDQVAAVLKEFPNQPVGIEGHTDNQPIRYSGWASNEALSLARSNAVAAYLATKHGLDRGRFMPIGYGEEHPIASNETAEGRQKNRRVEIVILPQASGKSYGEEAERRSNGSAGLYVK